MRRGDCRRFLTRSVSGAGVASIVVDCCFTPSKVAMHSPFEVGLGICRDMGRIPGVFARVTLACVRGAALMLAVDVGLVEHCWRKALALVFWLSRVEKCRPIAAVPLHGVRGIEYYFGVGEGWLGRVWRQFLRRHPLVLIVGCHSVLGRTLLGLRLGSHLWRKYGRAMRGNDCTQG